MESQFIEKNKVKIYSVYHEPTISKFNDVGIVLNYPLGQEYMRCHKLYVNIANQLASYGFHVLRYDYEGTGDSDGDFSVLSMESCLEDLDRSVKELREAIGINKVLLVGARFGATLSMIYAKKVPIDGLVMLSPIINGKKYLKEIEKDYKDWLKGSFTKEKYVDKIGMSIFGFQFTHHFLNEIKSIAFTKKDFHFELPVLVMANNEEALDCTENVTYKRLNNDKFWIKKETEESKSLVPIYEVNSIIEWVQQNS